MENYLLSSPTQLSQPYDYDENFDFLQNLYQPIDPLAQLQQLQSQQLHSQQQFQQLYQHHQQQIYQDQQQQLQQLQVPQQFQFPPSLHFEQPSLQQQQIHEGVPHQIQSQPLEQLPEDSNQLQDPYLENEEWTFPKSRSLNFDSINKSLLATPSTFVHKSSNSVTSITYEPPSTFNSPITPSRNRSLSYTRVAKTPKTPTPRMSRSISKISLDQFIQTHASGNTTSPKIDLLSPSNYTNTSATPLIKPRKPVMSQNSFPLSIQPPVEDLLEVPPPLPLVLSIPNRDIQSDAHFKQDPPSITLSLDSGTEKTKATATRSKKKSPSQSPLHSEPDPTLSTSTVPSTSFATITSTSATTSTTGSPPEPTTIPIPSNMVITKNRVRNNRSTQSREDKNKKYSCPICDGRFMRPEHVKRHLRSHTLEKPFECEQCQKTFNRKDNLKAHIKKIHKMI